LWAYRPEKNSHKGLDLPAAPQPLATNQSAETPLNCASHACAFAATNQFAAYQARGPLATGALPTANRQPRLTPLSTTGRYSLCPSPGRKRPSPTVNETGMMASCGASPAPP